MDDRTSEQRPDDGGQKREPGSGQAEDKAEEGAAAAAVLGELEVSR